MSENPVKGTKFNDQKKKTGESRSFRGKDIDDTNFLVLVLKRDVRIFSDFVFEFSLVTLTTPIFTPTHIIYSTICII